MINRIDFKFYPKDIDKLHNLELASLNGLMSSETIEELRSLLQSICDIQFCKVLKYDDVYKSFYDANHRYLFLNNRGENVISKIYQIVARCIAEEFYKICNPEFKLACYGSTIRGYSTIPLSIKYFNRMWFENKNGKFCTVSDIDFYLIYCGESKSLPYDITKEQSELLVDIISKFSEAMPDTIRFSLPKEVQQTTLNYLRENQILHEFYP